MSTSVTNHHQSLCRATQIINLPVEEWESQSFKNIYVGEGTKWAATSPFDREHYVRYIFERRLYLNLTELYGGNLGYTDSDVDEDGNSSASILADIVNRCLHLVDSMLYGANFSETMTLTFGEQSVGHSGMEISGSGLLPEGLSMNDLRSAQERFHKLGVVTELIELKDILPAPIGAQEAGILIVRGGIQVLFDNWCEINGREGRCVSVDSLYREQRSLLWDKHAKMRGEVKNKQARYNLKYGDTSIEPDYINNVSRVIAFKNIPLTQVIRSMIPVFLGSKTQKLQAEGNYYFRKNSPGDKRGIGFHGDAERKVVVACRIGSQMNIGYQWFLAGRPAGPTKKILINGGDFYAMSEKASGYDWKRTVANQDSVGSRWDRHQQSWNPPLPWEQRGKYLATLRHAAGHDNYFKMKHARLSDEQIQELTQAE